MRERRGVTRDVQRETQGARDVLLVNWTLGALVCKVSGALLRDLMWKIHVRYF